MSNPVFGNDIVDIISGGGDCGSFIKEGYDFGNLTLCGSGRECQDGNPMVSHGGSADKINLSANTADLL